MALLVLATALTGCGKDEADAPMLPMPDLVGKPVSAALAQTYDALHTSLATFDLSPADRENADDWVVVATSPAAGDKTPKFTKVFAWVLKASEYQWFTDNPTMPRIPAKADAAALVAKGGLLYPVRDLVQLRYQPGKAPKNAKASTTDAAAHTPDRGLHPDLATEPTAEFAARTGLLAAPAKGTVVAGTRPAPATDLRAGQYLVILVVTKPKEKPKPPAIPSAPSTPSISGDGSNSGGSSGGSGSGSGGSGSGGMPGLPSGFPTKLPNCPKELCG